MNYYVAHHFKLEKNNFNYRDTDMNLRKYIKPDDNILYSINL